MTSRSPDAAPSAAALCIAAHDLLNELSREHESCCGREAYALELAADDLAIILPRTGHNRSACLPGAAVGDRLGLVVRMLRHLLTLATTDHEQHAVTSAYFLASFAYLDH